MDNAETTTLDRYGVMGYPVAHSRSPVIHRLFALQTAQQIQYELLQVAPENLETAVRQFQRTGGKGLNVTVPHKQAVRKLCDHVTERAHVADAVNTLSFVDGEIHYNGTPEIMARYATMARDAGARIVGGCCGTSPQHVAAMREALDQTPRGPAPSLEDVQRELGEISRGAQAQAGGEHTVKTRGSSRRRRRS